MLVELERETRAAGVAREDERRLVGEDRAVRVVRARGQDDVRAGEDGAIAGACDDLGFVFLSDRERDARDVGGIERRVADDVRADAHRARQRVVGRSGVRVVAVTARGGERRGDERAEDEKAGHELHGGLHGGATACSGPSHTIAT